MQNNIPSEHAEQVCFVSNVKLLNSEILLHAIENSLQFVVPTWFPPKIKSEIGSLCKKISIERIKAGQINGIPDLFIPELMLYIEMKRTVGGIVSEHQKKVHELLRQKGYSVEIAFGAKQACEILERYKKREYPTLASLLSLVKKLKIENEELRNTQVK